MERWRLDYIRGLRWLRRHRPVVALRYFERAVESASFSRYLPTASRPSDRSFLSSLFAYLGVALRKVGMRNRGHASLVEAVRLVKRGIPRRALLAGVNEYGMASQATEEADDRHAFYGIKLAHYIRSKRSQRLGTRAEIDMVAELIDEAWCELRNTIDLPRLSPVQKLRLFEKTLVVFPFMSVPEAMKRSDIAVDFSTGRRIGPADRCHCGSGLPYLWCHGRTPGTDEALIGRF